MSNYGVVLFYTTSSAIRAEKVLENGNIYAKLIPTPRELSSDCGISLRFDWELADSVRNALEFDKVEIAGIHKIP
ncbi:DUF3343 domain-containing protein [Candidatus Poribacteria bacterium]|nr:DUF3343 domain-containing protein [Candidatus Poribacteria bacterium]